MKRVFIVLMVAMVAMASFGEGAKLTFPSSVYAYVDTATMTPTFELYPAVQLSFDKAYVKPYGDLYFDIKKGLTSGTLAVKAGYDFGFASAYVKPSYTLAGVIGFDTAVTFAIPKFPLTIEFTVSDFTKWPAGTLMFEVDCGL